MAFVNRASPSTIASHTDVHGLATGAKVRRTRAHRMRSRTNLSRAARASEGDDARSIRFAKHGVLGWVRKPMHARRRGAREAGARGKIVVSAA
jgi:hypothetical protein